jgi:tetratricopeptide (TPR) repeat protein/CHAT domain-containing protein
MRYHYVFATGALSRRGPSPGQNDNRKDKRRTGASSATGHPVNLSEGFVPWPERVTEAFLALTSFKGPRQLRDNHPLEWLCTWTNRDGFWGKRRLKRWCVLLALGLLLGQGSRALAQTTDPDLLKQQVLSFYHQGKYQEAIPLAEKLLAIRKRTLGPEHPDTAASLNDLAELYRAIGAYERAELLFQQALHIDQKVLGPEHPATAVDLNDLAELYQDVGAYDKAEPLYRQALQARQKVLGPEHPATAVSLNNLAELYRAMGAYEKAEPLFQQALHINQKVLGPEHPETAVNLNNLATLYENMGAYDKAEPLYRQALQIRQKALGPEHLDTAQSLNNLAVLYEAMGAYGKAEPLYRQALQIRRKALGPEHPDTAATLNNLAVLYERMGDYAKAEPLYRQALEVRRKVLGPEHPDTAASLNNLSVFYERMGAYDKAEPLLEQALQIRQKALGPEHPDTAASLNNLAALYENIGAYAKAEPLFQQALHIRQKALGSDHPDTTQSLNNLATLYDYMGDYAKAEPLYQQALTIAERRLGPEHPDIAQSLNNLAALYSHMGDYARAEPLLQRALHIRQKALGSEHPDTAATLNSLAKLYLEMGDYPRAAPLSEQALQIVKKVLGPEHPGTAQSLNDLAFVYDRMGDYARAEPLYQQALQIRIKVLGPEHIDTAQSLGLLAALYDHMGDYAKAEPLYQQALTIIERTLGPTHPDTAAGLNNLALLYEHEGEYEKAEPLLKQALQIRIKAFGPEHLNTALSFDNLAALYFRMGEYEKAEPLYQQALQINQKALGPEHPDTATSLNNLALLYDQMGEYEKAEPLLQQALQIHQKALGPAHPLTATSLNNLAALYTHMGEYEKAEPLLQQALQIRIKAFGPEHPLTATALNNLAFLKFDLGQIQEAKDLAQLTVKAQLGVLSRFLSFTSEEQRLAYENTIDPFSLIVLQKSEADLALAVLRYKGVVLDSLIEDRLAAQASKESGDRELVQRLTGDRRQLEQLILQEPKKPSSHTDQKIEGLEREVEQIEGQLARRVSGLGRARRALGVTVEQVQAAIPNDGALIEYLRYGRYLGKGAFEPCYGAVVLAAAGDPTWVPLGPAAELRKLVSSYQKSARGQTDATKLESDLRALHDRLWSPVESALRQPCRRVILSPDGPLNFVSFATLLDAEHCFLAERYAVQYVASGRDLLREASLPAEHPLAVVLANPDFERSASPSNTSTHGEGAVAMPGVGGPPGNEQHAIEGLHFDRLPGTQEESDRLTDAFQRWHWRTEAFRGPQASKAALRQVHAPYVLHLATHGFFLEFAAPSDTASLQPATLSIGGNMNGSKFFQNPMHGSGLVLAGAQRTLEAWRGGQVPPVDDDGIVTAEDVAALDLQGTWLVALSACDTGFGSSKTGEGVLGLRRGFVEAGAQNLLMTLWPIDDRVTGPIMTDFYAAAHERGNAAQALAEVQREWLVALRDGQGEKFEEVKAALTGGPGLAAAVRLAGPFILSTQGKP